MVESKEKATPENEESTLRKRNILSRALDHLLNRMSISMKSKLIIVFLIVMIIPLFLLGSLSWSQFTKLGETLRDISISDSSTSLNNSAIENIERMTTDTANEIAEFLYVRDDDVLFAASMTPSDESYKSFLESRQGTVTKHGEWVLSDDGLSWVEKNPNTDEPIIVESSNPQNNDNDGFNYRPNENFETESFPIYDEITFIDTNGIEQYKYVTPNSNKTNHPLSAEKGDVSNRENTYVKAETYFDELKKLNPGEIYVSDVTGAYVPSHFVGMYTPKQMVISALTAEINALKGLEEDASTEELTELQDFSNGLLNIRDDIIPGLNASESDNQVLMQNIAEEAVLQINTAAENLSSEGLIERKENLIAKINGLTFEPEKEAFAGKENPMGVRFEGIVRWATPVTDDSGEITGYVTLALNQTHITEFVDTITPMNERYINMPSAFEGNYAFIWDYKCRSIVHPRHHSIVGFDETTGDPQVPWLESSIFNAWQESGKEYVDFIKDVPTFDNQSREKIPAPELTKQGLVGLDGRYLNNAPQCTGWMDLTSNGGSGSFYILWSGLYKLTTAGTIPYFTGPYADSPRGFGFVSIGAGLEDFTRPAVETEKRLNSAILNTTSNTLVQFLFFTFLVFLFIVFIAIWLASFLTDNIMSLISGISKFRSGERHFRFDAKVKDEFGTLADSFDEMADSLDASIDDPLVITDNELIIKYKNDLASGMATSDQKIDTGIHYHDISVYPPGSIYDPILAMKENREAEVIYVDSKDMYFRGIANSFIDKEGNQSGYLIRSIDMTEMVKRQHELEKAVDAANQANEHKSNFLARMSHEIRTPMNAIIGLSNIVEKRIETMRQIHENDPNLDELKTNVDQIETSSQHLLGLLNDILDISKIESGKIIISETLMDITKLEGTITDIIVPRCAEKNIEFVTEFDEFEKNMFMFDSLRLRQVLINLLGNAVKFTPELGKIIFSVKLLDRKDGKSFVRFSVKDNGIGIPAEKKEHIFEAFEQADGTVSRSYGGTGLGLAISRRLVNMFGGDIELNSEVGKGSEFSFEIWMQEDVSDEIVETVEESNIDGLFRGKKALIVDDVEINRLIVVSLLEDTELEIDEADDGAEAVKMFEESPEGTYDMILMDIQMPVMDGYEASRKIRALDRSDAKQIPIIALTANAFKEDIDNAKASGMNAHISKPIEIDNMLEMMVRYMKKSDSDKKN